MIEDWDVQAAFSKRLRYLRAIRHVGVRELARRMGVTPSYISSIEHGRFAPPSEKAIKMIARILDDDPDELLACADKVSSDLLEIIKQDPRRWGEILREGLEE